MGEFSPFRLSGCVTNGEIVVKVVIVTSQFSPTFPVICDKGIVIMDTMGGRVVKGKWALKHSLRSQYLPIAPLVGCGDPIGRNISSPSVIQCLKYSRFAMLIFPSVMCIRLTFAPSTLMWLGGIFKSTGKMILLAGKIVLRA
jgi:hypothetical protein